MPVPGRQWDSLSNIRLEFSPTASPRESVTDAIRTFKNNYYLEGSANTGHEDDVNVRTCLANLVGV